MAEIANAIARLLQTAVDEQVFPGCAWAVLEGNEVSADAFGHHTYHPTSPSINVNTLYDTASLTKIITNVLAMRLIDSGLIQLDEPVGTYLPSFCSHPEKALVTVHHLLTYTVNFAVSGEMKSMVQTIPAAELTSRLLSFPLAVAPGTSYMYANLTTFVLTRLIETVTGNNFYAEVKRQIFAPLGMQTATFTPTRPDAIPPSESNAGEPMQGRVHDESTHYLQQHNISTGAAGMFASVADLIPFMRMVLQRGRCNDKPFVSPALVDQWTANVFADISFPTPLGWGDRNNYLLPDYPNLVIKTGFTGCLLVGDMSTQRGAIVLSNRTYPERPEDDAGFKRVKEGVVEILMKQ